MNKTRFQKFAIGSKPVSDGRSTFAAAHVYRSRILRRFASQSTHFPWKLLQKWLSGYQRYEENERHVEVWSFPALPEAKAAAVAASYLMSQHHQYARSHESENGDAQHPRQIFRCTLSDSC
ncbi:unnamed protein product [Cylicocyclus nassatus]|uniref:Uncharacterized protein n=1 Tax=Cylicocyclus nassatus TaxID=53992 RepID=A0AA36GIR0_CYLNA|nr:unnamed protein product [Cylicocyclus nassatus]